MSSFSNIEEEASHKPALNTVMSMFDSVWVVQAIELDNMLADMAINRQECEATLKDGFEGVMASDASTHFVLPSLAPSQLPLCQKSGRVTKLTIDCRPRETLSQSHGSQHSIGSKCDELQQAQHRIIELENALEAALQNQQKPLLSHDAAVRENQDLKARLANLLCDRAIEEEQMRVRMVQMDALKEKLKEYQERWAKMDEVELVRQDMKTSEGVLDSAFELGAARRRISMLENRNRKLEQENENLRNQFRDFETFSSYGSDDSGHPPVSYISGSSTETGSAHDAGSLLLQEENEKLRISLDRLHFEHEEECDRLRKKIERLSQELFCS